MDAYAIFVVNVKAPSASTTSLQPSPIGPIIAVVVSVVVLAIVIGTAIFFWYVNSINRDTDIWAGGINLDNMLYRIGYWLVHYI